MLLGARPGFLLPAAAVPPTDDSLPCCRACTQIRKREARIQHLQREIDKIKAKEKEMEELSAGQASTLVRWAGLKGHGCLLGTLP